MTTRQYIIAQIAKITAMKNEQLRWGMGMVDTIAAYRRSSSITLAEMNYLDGQSEKAKDRFFKDCSIAAAAQIEKDEKANRMPEAMQWVEVDTAYAAQSLEAEMNFTAEMEELILDAQSAVEAVEQSAAFMVAASGAETNDELPVYAAYTLIASYWYREAYKDLPLHVSQLSGRRAMYLKFAQWYDQLAGKHYGNAEHAAKYHDIYKIWRDNGFTFQMLRMLCHFQGVEVL